MTHTSSKKRYHFIGIGGVGMGTLATLLLAKGECVSGSDLKENAMTQVLKEKGAIIFIGHNQENVKGADCVVMSSAIKEDNPEILAAIRADIPILQRAKLLSELMEHHIGITIAGAHGKTTTTSMISHMLITAQFNPTTAVGGVLEGSLQNASLGAGKYFVAEVDESDGSFLCFHPQYSIITNIDFEHIDYYQNWENIIDTYRQFIEQTDEKGCLIYCGDDIRLAEIAEKKECLKLKYGYGQDNDFIAENISTQNMHTVFDCVLSGEKKGSIDLPLVGKHNVLNALACVSLGYKLSIEFDIIKKSLETYQGVNRRFQFIGSIDGISVIDDYGHHPTEIEATLTAAQSVKNKRLLTVFQPHRYSRTKHLMSEFCQCLCISDHVIITDIYAANEAPIDGINAQELCRRLVKDKDCSAVYVKKDKIVEYLHNHAETGDLVLTLGAGDINQVGEQFLAELRGKAESKVEKITEKNRT